MKKEKEMNSSKNGRRKRNIIKEYIADYLTNSNLHGLKYIVQEERTTTEKIFWMCLFIVCFVLCAGLIRNVWIKWNECPVIVSLAENTTPVSQIPYPAVTICLETKSPQRKFNFTKFYHLYSDKKAYYNLSEYDRNRFEDISMVCDSSVAPSHGRKMANASEIIANLEEVSLNITEVFFGCKWKDVSSENCSHIVSPIITEEGLCYTFNILADKELFRKENLNTDYSYLGQSKEAESWSLDEGYAPDTPVETYPHRGSGYGAKSGLTLVMKSNIYDQDYLCGGPIQGFKVLLHNPAELPRLSQQYFRAPLSQEVVVSVKPKIMTTSETLRSYDPERRKCYFPNERYLLYFKVYTQANCEMECLTNFTYYMCGCVHFGMPHAQNIPVCTVGSMACLKNAQTELVNIEIQSAMKDQQGDVYELSKARKIAQQCKCLPACTSIEYEAETSQATYDWDALFQAYKFDRPQELINVSASRLLVYFKDPQFITNKRSELYGLTDFLANCGGLLGLFMGFSFMSLVEILYFLTLRSCCIFRQHRRQLASKYPKGDP